VANDIDNDLELKRAARYLNAGKYKRADPCYRAILDQRPDELRALVAMARIDAELGRTTFDDALTRIEELATLHPESDRVQGPLISILFKMGRKEEIAEVRRSFFDCFPESPTALQLWANGLQVDPTTKDEPDTQATAWGFYQQALSSGPLLTPCFKSAAYYAAKRADPSHKNEAIQGSGLVERMALRTRGLGPQMLSAIYFVGFFLSLTTVKSDFVFSLVAQALTLSWGLWCVYANNLMCCKKCRNAWIFLISYSVVAGAIFDHPKTWYLVAGVAAVVGVWATSTGHRELFWPKSKSEEKENALN
jgi:tetratricopeptide (TPR) repeat protein